MAAKSVSLIVAGTLGVYACLCLFAAPWIGRSRPEVARFLRPPLFNFDHSYGSGSVLGIPVGLTKAAVVETVTRQKMQIDPACWGDNRAGGIALYSAADARDHLLKEDDWCFTRGRTSVRMIFSGNQLRTVIVRYVTTELAT
ncbi:MAG: hypothetical protein JWO81_132 [Alphaproteobacteria bacterium]|nr:hypothetical protein [Alphaproteobacteria bacterium]